MRFTFWPSLGCKSSNERMLLFLRDRHTVGKVFSEAQCCFFAGLCQSLVHIVSVTVLLDDAESPVTGA